MVHHGHSVWIWSAPTLQLSHSALKPIPSLFLFRQMSNSVTSGLLLLTGLSCCTLCLSGAGPRLSTQRQRVTDKRVHVRDTRKTNKPANGNYRDQKVTYTIWCICSSRMLNSRFNEERKLSYVDFRSSTFLTWIALSSGEGSLNFGWLVSWYCSRFPLLLSAWVWWHNIHIYFIPILDENGIVLPSFVEPHPC